MLPYDAYLHLMGELDALVASLEGHPDRETREAVLSLLNGIDLLHREGLHRLVEAVRERGNGSLVEEAVEGDPVIRAFLGLYDLAELDLPDDDPPPSGTTRVAPPPGTSFVPLERVTVRGRPVERKPREGPGP